MRVAVITCCTKLNGNKIKNENKMKVARLYHRRIGNGYFCSSSFDTLLIPKLTTPIATITTTALSSSIKKKTVAAMIVTAFARIFFVSNNWL
jgi:hypothetical protein